MNQIKKTVIILSICATAWTQHFEPVWFGEGDEQTINPIQRHALLVTSAILNDVDLQTGDEIGVFDGTTCVGAGTVNGIISLENMLVVKASKAQGDIPGYTVGEPISFRYWDSSAQMEIEDIATWLPEKGGAFEGFPKKWVR